MPPGEPRPDSRVYTPRRWQPATNELDVDFVLHQGGQGPGSRWVQGARVGDHVAVSGPGGPYRIDPAAEQFVLAGDHSALPGIATILAELPAAARVRVLVEVPEAADELPLTGPTQLSVTRRHGGHDASMCRQQLAAALKALDLSPAAERVFVACEATVMRDIRRHLVYERGFDRTAIHTHGYWKCGASAHPDRDLGDDV